MKPVLKVSFDPKLAQPKKRSLTIAGHNTSITLEDAFWIALKQICVKQKISMSALVAAVDAVRGPASLSASLRVYILNELQAHTFASREGD